MRPRVAVLVDLPREINAGGHVKYWERIAEACAREKLPLDLTVYFSGDAPAEDLAENVHFRYLKPVFSTSRLPFLPYTPAPTDLARFHPQLAQELPRYDVIHATDGFFAFARTAERVASERHIPRTLSFHTDTPSYVEFFARRTMENVFGKTTGGIIDSALGFARRQKRLKEKRLRQHIANSAAVFALRAEDRAFVAEAGRASVLKPMRLGVDKSIFGPDASARAEIEKGYGIGPNKFLVLFVGRVDAAKNVPLLLGASAQALAQGARLHLLVAGAGPLEGDVRATLKENATLLGTLSARDLARIYAAADCLAMASDIEIGGLVGIEALACGCPVLASKKAGVKSLMPDGAATEIDSAAAAWARELASLAQNKARQNERRNAALLFRDEKVADWADILKDDFLPVWQSLYQPVPFGKRILILVPHPDDEVAACAASIAAARAGGATVMTLYLTHGCLARETLWPWQRKKYDTLVAARRREAENAASFLGIVPVGWSPRPARALWRNLPEALADVRAAIAQHRPDQIWVPAYEGGNPDHDATNAIGAKLRGEIGVLEFAEYNFSGRRSRSQTFISDNDTARVHFLSPEEQAHKERALKIYASEKRNLHSLKTLKESFRPLGPYAYALPPHAGTLWYTRFQWVPFRHPRVDFTDPRAVCSALSAFLSDEAPAARIEPCRSSPQG